MYYLSNVCFVCLSDKNLYNVLDRNEEPFETITFVLPELTISEAEIPVHICSSCNKNLQNIYNLKRICLDNFYLRFGSALQTNCDRNKVVIKQENVCLICSEDKRLRNLFDEDGNDSFNEISFGIPEMCIAETNVSPKVCSKCTTKLLHLYKLKKKYLESYCRWTQFPDKFGVNDSQKMSDLHIKIVKFPVVIKSENIEMEAEDPVLYTIQNEFENILNNSQNDFKIQIIARIEDVAVKKEHLEFERFLIAQQIKTENENINEYDDEEYVSESEEDIFADNSDDDKDFQLDSDCVDDSDSNISANNNDSDPYIPANNQESSDEEGFKGFENGALKCNQFKYNQENDNVDKSNNSKTKQKSPTSKKQKLEVDSKTKENLTSKKNKQKLPEISESKETSQNINAVRSKKSKNRISSCAICGKVLASKASLQRHIDVVHLEEQKFGPFDYPCSMCKRTYRTEIARERHIDKDHLKLKIARSRGAFKCVLCDKVLLSRFMLRSHYFMHLNIKLSQCDFCGLKFKTSCKLKEHSQIHINKRDAKCSVCGKIFPFKSEMQIHKNIVHYGLSAHQCSVCNKYFNQLKDLREHFRIHLGLYIHCDICNKRYGAARSLMKHKLLHHGISEQTVHVDSK